jgi:hypothetical protein
MSKLNSKFQYMYDAAPTAALRLKTDPQLVATAALPGLALDKIGGFWNTAGELADKTLAVVVNVTAVDPDGTYDIELQGGPVGFASNKVIGALKGVTAPGQYVILVDIGTAKRLKADLAALRLNAIVTDTDGAGAGVPGITFYSWIAPVQA